MDLQNQKLKKDLKKQKEKENAMTTEMDEKKLEICKFYVIMLLEVYKFYLNSFQEIK